MLRDIELGGILGRKFGKHHRLDVRTAREAVQALSVINPAFKKYFMEAHTAHGRVFAFYVGGRNIEETDIDMPAGSQKIRIQPVIQGSKQAGLLQTIVGAVLIVVGVIGFGLSGGVTSGLIAAGIGMVAGGVIQMLSPQPKKISLDGGDAANQANYAFGNPVNTTAQGNPVGLGYGFREIGGAIISAEITTQDF